MFVHEDRVGLLSQECLMCGNYRQCHWTVRDRHIMCNITDAVTERERQIERAREREREGKTEREREREIMIMMCVSSEMCRMLTEACAMPLQHVEAVWTVWIARCVLCLRVQYSCMTQKKATGTARIETAQLARKR